MVTTKAYIVVGLGYGDEGKGLTTDYLCLRNKKPLVIRFNGGHQAGHCVVTEDGKRHVFSNFGSGTLRNIPTYWSSYCTFAPVFFIEELALLDFQSKIYIDKFSPITTHYDILYNRTLELTLGNNRKGSCGVGFGATIDRQKDGPSLLFKDLFDYEENLEKKLNIIKQYYRYKVNLDTAYNFDKFSHIEEDEILIKSIKKVKNLLLDKVIIPVDEKEIFEKNWLTYIFEGAQGILLDKKHGDWPHITKSNTTSKNAIEIIKKQNLNIPLEVFYVTRAYQTRHGNGPFNKKHPDFYLINNNNEINVSNKFQGEFKCNYLDLNAINYALKCDREFSFPYPKNLMITCLDQIGDENIRYFHKGELKSAHYASIHKNFEEEFISIKYSFSACAENIE